MRPRYFAAIAALAIAPVVKAVTSYDSLTYPLLYPGATVTLPGVPASSGSVTGYQAGSVNGNSTSNDYNAVFWSASSGTATDLQPYSGYNTVAEGADASQQVGGYAVGTQPQQAALWSGLSSSRVLLNPAGFNSSTALAVSGNEQVGTGYIGSSTVTQALLWTGTAASAVTLNASTSQSTYAVGTDGTHQVGGVATGGINSAARLWTGTAASAVDLTPTSLPGLTSSFAYGVSGTQQVGVAFPTQPLDPFGQPDYQAVVWNSSGASAVNLTPTTIPGVNAAYAYGTNGSQQVGYGYNYSGGSNSVVNFALLWSGTAASAVNLNSDLPLAGTWTKSTAYTVDNTGTIAGTATGTARGVNASFGVNWIPTSSTSYHRAASGEIYQFAASTTPGVTTRTLPGFGVSTGGFASISPAANASNRQLFIISGNGLQLGSNVPQSFGLFDVTNNDLDLPSNQLSTTYQQIAQAFNNGTWNGSGGITSSAAAADTTHLTALGYMTNNQSGSAMYSAKRLFDGFAPGAGDVLVKYTYDGDTNLDGVVDGTDYSRVDVAYLADRITSAASTGWFNGDFNYDGTVNGSDYTLMDNAFNRQSASMSASVSAETATTLATTAVPEPTDAIRAIVTVAAAGILLRRRRGRMTKFE